MIMESYGEARESVIRQDSITAHIGNKKVLYLLVIVVLSYFFFFFNLGSYSLKEPDEGRYAEIPREIVEQGDYMVPHLNYVRYFEKPPLLYWLTALSFKVFGVNEWSFRLPNALIALLCVVITYLFAVRWFSIKVALLSALMLMSCFSFIALAHIVTIDMLFSSLLFISLLCFLGFYREEKPLFLYLFFSALALAVLAKGPVALILMGVTIVLFLLTEKKVSFLKKMASAKSLLLFFLIAAPWFIAICLKEREFFQFFFIDQHILRFLTTKHHRSGPLYYFIPVLLGGLFPWSVFLPRALIRLWHMKALRLFFIWSAVVFAFFSLSGSKLPPYILPIFPALCIILAVSFEANWQRFPRDWETIIYGVFFSFIALAGMACGSGSFDRYLVATPDIISLLKDIRGFSWAVAGISFIVVISLMFKGIRTFRSLFFLLGGFSLLIVITIMFYTHVIDKLNTTKGLAEIINGKSKTDTIVVNYGSFDETLPFYLKKRTYIANYTGEIEMGSKHEDAKQFFLDDDEFIRLFQSDRHVWIVFKEKRFARLEGIGIKGNDTLICLDNRCVMANLKDDDKK